MMFSLLLAMLPWLCFAAVLVTPTDQKGTIFLTPREAAAELRISEKSLYNFSEPRGPIRKIVIGSRCVRYDREQLREDVLRMRGEETK